MKRQMKRKPAKMLKYGVNLTYVKAVMRGKETLVTAEDLRRFSCDGPTSGALRPMPQYGWLDGLGEACGVYELNFERR